MNPNHKLGRQAISIPIAIEKSRRNPKSKMKQSIPQTPAKNPITTTTSIKDHHPITIGTPRQAQQPRKVQSKAAPVSDTAGPR